MRLTVLGNSSRYLVPLGAGTCYLVEAAGRRVLLDCGNGTHLRLAERLGNEKLDAVVVSHFHIDNVLDLLPVLLALPEGAPVLIPEGAEPRFTELLRSMGMDRSRVERADLRLVNPGEIHNVGGVELRFASCHHGCLGLAVRVDAKERSLAYFSDTAPSDDLAELAQGADLLVAHTLLLDREAEGPTGETNMSAGAAGRIAAKAGVKRLGLSHIPFYRQASLSREEAERFFGGETFVLEEFKTYEV